jgi:hypothetical protein
MQELKTTNENRTQMKGFFKLSRPIYIIATNYSVVHIRGLFLLQIVRGSGYYFTIGE